MAIFLQPAYDVSQYPQFIQDVWNQMLETGIVVIECITQILRQSYPIHIIFSIAFQDVTIGLFDDLTDLDDYKWLQANLLSKGVNSVLTAEVPITKDAKARSDSTVITPDTILGYQDFFAENISGNILPFFAPFS